jgi:hypothetical protein
MNAFETIRADFETNWTTLLVGWNGSGPFSPWPDRADEFPPWLSSDDIAAYAADRLAASSDVAEQNLIVRLLSLNLRTESRQAIRDSLTCLSRTNGGNPAVEVRKWRLVFLEALLNDIPRDTESGLMALTEFWQSFGFPVDSPHEVQGRGNSISAFDYFQEQNLHRMLDTHRAWAQDERTRLRKR